MPSNGLALDLALRRVVEHGTPIDGGRRSAGAGNGSTSSEDAGEVTEDEVLFSTVRSTSIGSTPHPSQRSRPRRPCSRTSRLPSDTQPPASARVLKIQLPGIWDQPQLIRRVGVDHAEGRPSPPLRRRRRRSCRPRRTSSRRCSPWRSCAHRTLTARTSRGGRRSTSTRWIWG
ncbi:hypothetical protein DFH08DRAFT_396022 [Mycena albidolilacea]|uniref:Uncharacterized protein n=1 Tax=Mycena albidolilacea TaxID=1033008 RepID=A0AAD6ZDM7_9AGAR|nr:hypothetical protein DFH08DRAFT_396022 [Mycena albidolilacea]